ncbi:hypothetical protein [Pseudorhodoferax sp. Leaf265]|uniref:hypothetical protein n=1 Tax=Pseudorhodoferax sp. Leaf265 TaxID=1736315 RepID=UPI0006F67894|nr:hypothetical protein [Pseudorhodoferax sp. Leaf265]KQP19956.1 hypothetical protein ASF45_22945 [Pseudorhodoferax sp. Leaf265]
MSTNTYHITFPSIHGSTGRAFDAEADAPTEALAVRSVLEACAKQGVTLDYVVLSHLHGLDGAWLDGLRLNGCKVEDSDLSGASWRAARIKGTTFRNVLADGRTHFDDSLIWNVEFAHCTMNGLHAPRLNGISVHFNQCNMDRWDVTDGRLADLKVFNTSCSGWKAAMATFRHCDQFTSILAASDLTEPQRAAVRAMSASNGDRLSAQAFADVIEAQLTSANK